MKPQALPLDEALDLLAKERVLEDSDISFYAALFEKAEAFSKIRMKLVEKGDVFERKLDRWILWSFLPPMILAIFSIPLHYDELTFGLLALGLGVVFLWIGLFLLFITGAMVCFGLQVLAQLRIIPAWIPDRLVSIILWQDAETKILVEDRERAEEAVNRICSRKEWAARMNVLQGKADLWKIGKSEEEIEHMYSLCLNFQRGISQVGSISSPFTQLAF